MESVELSRVRKIAEGYDKTLKATDPRFYRNVMIKHQDEGTVLTYDNAFALKYGEWFMIFAEHHDTQVYHENDVDIYQRGERIEVEDFEYERL